MTMSDIRCPECGTFADSVGWRVRTVQVLGLVEWQSKPVAYWLRPCRHYVSREWIANTGVPLPVSRRAKTSY